MANQQVVQAVSGQDELASRGANCASASESQISSASPAIDETNNNNNNNSTFIGQMKQSGQANGELVKPATSAQVDADTDPEVASSKPTSGKSPADERTCPGEPAAACAAHTLGEQQVSLAQQKRPQKPEDSKTSSAVSNLCARDCNSLADELTSSSSSSAAAAAATRTKSSGDSAPKSPSQCSEANASREQTGREAIEGRHLKKGEKLGLKSSTTISSSNNRRSTIDSDQDQSSASTKVNLDESLLSLTTKFDSSNCGLANPLIQQHHHQQQHIGASQASANNNNNNNSNLNGVEFCKRRRLSYLQSLLLRKWPCLALAICIMSSLLFGMLLSALTVYLMHDVATDCSSLVAATAANLAREPPAGRRQVEFTDAGGELASLTASGLDALGAGSGGGTGSRLYAAAASSSASSLAAAAASDSGEKLPFQRLPTSIWPIHYDLFVQPHIAEPFNFTGKVSIHFRCSEATDNITLHSLDLQLSERTLSLKLIPSEANNRTQHSHLHAKQLTAPKVSGLEQDKHLQYSIIKLDSNLEAGREYLIGIDFNGTLNDDLAGFYRIKYSAQNSSEPIWIAATQFQATDARRAFPCFDEPLFKATFGIQIKHWKNMTALSNMPIINRQDSPDGLWVTDTFSKSHRMSTYLVAFAVTNFESRSEGNISVWTRPGLVHTAEYALKIAGKILRHYEDFFGIQYPLPKMDMIALPDFNAGAMENWGLITYRETAMLYDELRSSVGNKQRVAVVVAHELAHQWFGNLVTPKWWDDLWLNEGFASYVEYIGVDHVEPRWKMLDQFIVEEVQNVFRLDSLSSSHQISIPVNNPDEISEIFDHISYAKGASIIRMMNHFLTEQVLKAGLKRYLRALAYNNAEQSDLWTHLTAAQRLASSGNSSSLISPANQNLQVDVGKVMNSWTLQTGFPLVTLTRKYADGQPGAIRGANLKQARYVSYDLTKSSAPLNNQSSSPLEASGSWEIPITYTWKSEQNWNPITRLWMHQNDTRPVELAPNELPKSDNEWMLVNVGEVGYYRVNYDLRNWKLLIDQLDSDHKQIGATNRAQILDDIFELARSGNINYRFAMEATKYLKNELDFLPWETILGSISYVDEMLVRTPIYGDWKDYIADLIGPYYARYKDLDWTTGKRGSAGRRPAANSSSSAQVEPPAEGDSNDVLAMYNQVNAIAWACEFDEHCIQKAKSTFAEWRRTGVNNIQAALRHTTYCTAIQHGKKADWEFLWRAYEMEQNPSEKDRILRALGCSRETWILARYLEWCFDKSKPIRRQDGSFVFRLIAKNNYGRDIAFNFMRERWPLIKEFYGKTSFSLGHLIRSISISMNTNVELQQLNNFYESIKNDVGTGKRAFQIAIEEVETNVQWRERSYKILESWLNEARARMSVKVSAAAAA